MSQVSDLQDSLGPARPERLATEFFAEPDGLMVRTRRGGGPGVFLLIWLIGWSVGCVFLIGHFLAEPGLFSFLFGVPFWASWLAAACFLVWCFFGRETLLVRQDRVLFLRTALIKLSERSVPIGEVEQFRECQSTMKENERRLWGIEMVTLGKPLRFAFRLSEGEREWLIFQLNNFLQSLGAGRTAPQLPRSASSGHALQPNADAGAKEVASSSFAVSDSVVTPANAASDHGDQDDDDDDDDDETTIDRRALSYADTLPDPPTDSAWRLDDDYEAFAVSQRGRFKPGTVLALLFINAFWNGIVSLFLLALFDVLPQKQPIQGSSWWGLFLFLIPFEVIGLAMFLALIASLFEPVHWLIWRFEADRVIRKSRWPLLAWTRSWPVDRLDRLELRGGDTGDYQELSAGNVTGGAFDLALVGPDNADICTVPKLTEGEARWLARLIYDRRSGWMPK